ncbi:PQ-loop-domain-containing protein [Martensiomyces pterosporus]|nr:PQ-loop-domain-containing protein [Martensiomyces pterosporus]
MSFSQIALSPSVGEAVSTTLGWTYFVAWSVSFYPQIILNHKRKSVEGLSIDFLVYNVYGFACYALFNTAFYFSKSIGEEYARRNDGHKNLVRFNDLFFSYHALALSIVTFAQSFYYKLGCSMIKYMPQAWLNYTRKSTVGWSIHNILLDFTGGVLSFAQLILDAIRSGNVAEALGNPVKFGMGLASIGFDIIFMTQHYLLYTTRYDPQDIEAQLRYQNVPNYGSAENSDADSV